MSDQPPTSSERPDAAPPGAQFVAAVTGAQRALHAFIFSLTHHTADAHDVLQETNVVLWRKAAEFAPGTNFQAWAFKVAEFQVLAHRRRQQRSRLQFDDELVEQLADERETAEDFAQHDARRVALAHCLEKLDAPQRQLIARRYEPEASVNDLAAERGVSPKALSATLRRIREALLACIERTIAREARTA
jgi:RNA polymerase sigma-70 factor (ECF subfamily)